ncbi:MAG: ATP-binding protein [Dehalococcoidia bacterium]|nr:ATP-binding protein [Dehalococcoidia bacterium]
MQEQNTRARQRLGVVVGGSLTKGVDIKLDAGVSVEDLAVGRFVTIQGQTRRFFGVLTDVTLTHTDPRWAQSPPETADPFIAEVIVGATSYANAHVTPYLSLSGVAGTEPPAPAKTVPPHFAIARTSDPAEVQAIFGTNDDSHIWIGSPLDMEEAPVCLDINRITERSSGVFGKTGTGKSFLTRILLAQLLQKSDAVSLIFDMHSEYGWGAKSEGGAEAKGLKQLFSSKVAVFTLDPEGDAQRNRKADLTVHIGIGDITADDIGSIAGVLNLTDIQVQIAQSLEDSSKKGWLSDFLNADTEEARAEIAGRVAAQEGSIGALWRKLTTLKRLDFIKEKPAEDTVKRLMEYLEAGKHVVLEFGRYRNNLVAYILVANLLTRRIHDLYVSRMEAATGGRSKEPRPLVIVIEEAHKFLSPQVAGYTTFGTIARELRKYNVTLLIVDQRPSGIDTEVLSQIGTKLTCLLEDDRDIDAVLSGVSGRQELRAVLAKLETRQQALIFGHAVPMPVVVRTRDYNEAFYRSVGARSPAEEKAALDKDVQDLFR